MNYYLILNGKGQPLLETVTGHIWLFHKLADAKYYIKRTKNQVKKYNLKRSIVTIKLTLPNIIKEGEENGNN